MCVCPRTNTVHYLIAFMDVVIDQLKQKPHSIPQYEGGDQVPVDDVSKTSDAPAPHATKDILLFIMMLS